MGKNTESEHVITTRLLREVCLEMMRSVVIKKSSPFSDARA